MGVREGPSLAVDIIIRINRGIVLIKRENEPFRDMWAIPGGFVKYGEKVEDAAIREAEEETGLEVSLETLVGIYSDPQRDPREHVVSICYKARREGGTLCPDSDAKDVKVFKDIPWNSLAFDHDKMLRRVDWGD